MLRIANFYRLVKLITENNVFTTYGYALVQYYSPVIASQIFHVAVYKNVFAPV